MFHPRIFRGPMADEKSAQDDHNLKKKRGGRKHKGSSLRRALQTPEELVAELLVPPTPGEDPNSDIRENSLRCLASCLTEHGQEPPDLAKLLWYSCGVAAVLLQEVVSVYGKIYSEDMSVRAAKRVSNVLTLMQCIASDPETRPPFLKAQLPLWVFPLIDTKEDSEVYEYMRSAGLALLGRLCQVNEAWILKWLLENQAVETCTAAMAAGNQISKAMATYIVATLTSQLNPTGIDYLCSRDEKLLAALLIQLASMIKIVGCDPQPSPRFLGNILQCYLHICSDSRGLYWTIYMLPRELHSGKLEKISQANPIIEQFMHKLLTLLGIRTSAPRAVLTELNRNVRNSAQVFMTTKKYYAFQPSG